MGGARGATLSSHPTLVQGGREQRVLLSVCVCVACINGTGRRLRQAGRISREEDSAPAQAFASPDCKLRACGLRSPRLAAERPTDAGLGAPRVCTLLPLSSRPHLPSSATWRHGAAPARLVRARWVSGSASARDPGRSRRCARRVPSARRSWRRRVRRGHSQATRSSSASLRRRRPGGRSPGAGDGPLGPHSRSGGPRRMPVPSWPRPGEHGGAAQRESVTAPASGFVSSDGGSQRWGAA